MLSFFHREANERYRQSTDTAALKAKQKKKFKIYNPLIDGLRPLASKEGLPHLELLREFAIYESGVDESASQACVCGKQNIK